VLLAEELPGAAVEKKVMPLEVLAPYAWMGGEFGKAEDGWIGVPDWNWTGLGECARMTHPPRKLSTLAMPIQYLRIFLNSFMSTSLIAGGDGDLALAVDLDQAVILQVNQ
jgi:hypothetical protein